MGVAALGVAGLVGISLALLGSSGAHATDAVTATPIKHLVVIYDENESYDHYFGTYPVAANTDGVTFPATTAPANRNLVSDHVTGAANPNSTKPFRLTKAQAATCDGNHNYNPEQQAMDYASGKARMDKFPQHTSTDSCSGLFGTAGLTMGYFDGNTVTGLWNYAQNYAMSDNAWDTVFGPSTPGAIDLASGNTYGGTAYSSISDDTNPTVASTHAASGLSAVSASTHVGTLIGDPDPVYDDCSDSSHTTSSNVVGLQGKNIGDLLNAKGVTWGWFQGGFTPSTPYAGSGYAVCNTAHTGLVASPLDYSPHHDPFQYYKSTSNPHHLPPSAPDKIGQTDQANHQYDLTAFTTVLDAGTLPAVSYLKAPAYQDGHPGNSDPIDEQHFLTTEINQIESSTSWPSTAIVVTYDDSDGWYDHVAPTITNGSKTSDDAAICTSAPTAAKPLGGFQDRCGPSQRLPFLVISPFARSNYIDHTRIAQTSVLRFIEQNWELPAIGGGSFDNSFGSIDSLFDFQDPQQETVSLKPDGEIDARTPVPVTIPPAAAFSSTVSTSTTISTYGRAASLAVTVSSIGDVTDGASVSAKVDGKTVGTKVLTGPTVSFALPATLAVGSHAVALSYTGSVHAQAATRTSILKVVKAGTVTSVVAKKAKHKKETVTVKVSEPGSSLKPTGKVTGTVNGHAIKAKVLKNGTIRFTVAVHSGRNKVKFSYHPTGSYLASSKSITARY
jgi:phospholipase C